MDYSSLSETFPCLGIPLDVDCNIDASTIITPSSLVPNSSHYVPNTKLKSYSYAIYRLRVNSTLGKRNHWHGTANFLLQESYSRINAPLSPLTSDTCSDSIYFPPDSIILTSSTSNTHENYQSHNVQEKILWKRYSEFDCIHRYLSKKYPDIPPLPLKTLKRDLTAKHIEKRRQGLDDFLKDICQRRDIMADQRMVIFLECEIVMDRIIRSVIPFSKQSFSSKNNYRDFYKKLVKLKSDDQPHNTDTGFLMSQKLTSPSSNVFPFSTEPLPFLEVEETCFNVSRLHWYPDSRLLVLGSGDFSFLSRFDSFLVNVRLPWESKQSPLPTGRISFWQLRDNFVNNQFYNAEQHSILKKGSYKFNPNDNNHYCGNQQDDNQEKLTFLDINKTSKECDVSENEHQKAYNLNTIKQQQYAVPQFDLLRFEDYEAPVESLYACPISGNIFVGLSNGTLDHFRISVLKECDQSSFSNGFLGEFTEPPQPLPITDEPTQQHSIKANTPETLFKEEKLPKNNNHLYNDILTNKHVIVQQESAASLGYLLPRHTEAVASLCYDHMSSMLYSGSLDRSIKVYNLEKHQLISEAHNPSSVSSLVLISNLHLLIAGSLDGTLCYYEICYDYSLRLLLDIPPKSTFTCSAGFIRTSHTARISCLLYNQPSETNNNNHIISGSSDGTICVWQLCSDFLDPTSPRCTLFIKRCIAPLRHKITCMYKCGHPTWLNMIAVGTSAGTIHIISGVDYTLLFGFRAHSAAIGCINWLNDGSTLITGGSDRLVRWWHLQSLAYFYPKPNLSNIVACQSFDSTLQNQNNKNQRNITSSSPSVFERYADPLMEKQVLYIHSTLQ